MEMAQPPAKRQRMTVSVGGGGAEMAAAAAAAMPVSPGSRKLRHTLLVVLFLVRVSAMNTVTTSFSRMSRMVQRHIDRTVHKYFDAISRKLESSQKQIDGLHHEVKKMQKQLSRLLSNRQADQHTSIQTDHEHGSANGFNTSFQLHFLNDPKTPIYTERNIIAEDDSAIKIALFEGDKMITEGPLSKAKVDILVLRGDFSNDGREIWTKEEFNNYIVQGRDGQGFVLGGDCTVWLTNGVTSCGRLRFKEGSSRTRSRKFIIAARVCEAEKIGVRVQEAIMKPVTVLDRRNEANEKRHPPKLDDEVYRLEEISKDGIYHQRLKKVFIFTVHDFLKALNKDENKLRGEVLQVNKKHNSWRKMVKHARECILPEKHELKSYRTEMGNVVLFFDYVHFLVGAEFDGRYTVSSMFNRVQQDMVDKLKQFVYDRLDVLPFDHIMKGGFPVPNFTNANSGAGSSRFMPSAPQPDQFGHRAADQGIEAAEGLGHAQNQIESSCAIANNDPSSSIPGHCNAHSHQDQGTLPSGQEKFLWAPTDCNQNPLGQLNAEEIYSETEHDEIACYLNQLAVSQSYYGPAEMSMLSQMQQAPLPSNGLAEASIPTQNQSDLTPQQRPHFHGSMAWDKLT